ncbi:MAG: hypothetical protein Q8M16_18625 [Pirellulaceae bacterium]|nr:hypothetical protein [Pirellulaceae bacterium]
MLLSCGLASQQSFGWQEQAPVTESAPAPDEDWLYLQNTDLRIGFLRSHGGAVAYLSPVDSKVNLLNHFDHGRLIQQSYYGDTDGSLWAKEPWRYNPVQGGDYQGSAAKLLAFTSTESSAYAKTTPRHWATGELLNECIMEQWIELRGPVVKLRFKFHYAGKKSHGQRHQETPAMFLAPELRTLVTYDQDKPWTDGPLSRRIPGWPNEYVAMTESWIAYVGEDGRGVGIYVPEVTEATAYRFQGGSGSDCSYVAPLKTFALTPELTYAYTAYLTLGDVETIRARFAEIVKEQP